MPELKDTKYYRDLQRKAKSLDRTTAYRAQAELEDIGDGHWDGPRTDDPPESWFHASADSIPSIRHPNGIADTASGEPIILVLHRARKQDSAPLTRYKSDSGAFKFSVDWGYVDTNIRVDPEHIELHVILPEE
jgi:hypothetical protein